MFYFRPIHGGYCVQYASCYNLNPNDRFSGERHHDLFDKKHLVSPADALPGRNTRCP